MREPAVEARLRDAITIEIKTNGPRPPMTNLADGSLRMLRKLFSYSVKSDQFKLANGLIMLACLSCVYTTWTGYTSDALYAYSQSKDLLQSGSLSGWTFSAIPYFFPDVLMSLPFAAIISQPLVYYFATAPVQVILLVILLSLHISKQQETQFQDAFLTLAVVVSLIALIGPIVLGKPFFFMVQPYFVFVHHGFAALCATTLFLLFQPNDYEELYSNKSRAALICILFIVLTISDFYFALYIGFFVLTRFNLEKWQRHVAVIGMVGVFSIAIFTLSFVLNPSLALQATQSIAVPPPNQLATILTVVAILMLPVFALLFSYFSGSCISQSAARILISTILVAAFLLILGQIKDQYNYRYITIIFPVAAYLLGTAFLAVRKEIPFLIIGLVFALEAVSLIYTGLLREQKAWHAFADEVECISNLEQPPATIVAEYWPAKIVFESLQRKYNLIQVDAQLKERNWVYNQSWRTLHPPIGSTILVVKGINQGNIDRVSQVGKSKLICGEKLVLINRPASEVLQFDL